MGTGDITLRGNPAMDWHPIQGRVAIFLGMLHAKETGISSGHFGLWLVCAFAIYLLIPRIEIIESFAICKWPIERSSVFSTCNIQGALYNNFRGKIKIS